MKDHPSPAAPEQFLESDIYANGVKRWRRVQRLTDIFWDLWKKNYLNRLQSRGKWWKSAPTLKEGDAVIVKDKFARRNEWPLARVMETMPSSDGTIRSCIIKTRKGTYRRPVNVLVPLGPGN